VAREQDLSRSSKGGDGLETWLAPGLNFLPARVVSNGWIESLSDVRFEEPDVSMFEPPPGAAIEHHSRPGGIVFKPGPPR
jgi:hypothetical protein